jgi:type I restriction enzyme, S subunit
MSNKETSVSDDKQAQKRELRPRLRFPGFQMAGAWEKKKIGQIADFYKGKGISKADIVTDGNQPCIRYGELYTSYGEVIDEVISKTNLPSSDLFLSKNNDVIIPASGETKIDIATASCVTQDNVALGGDLNIIRSGQNGIFLSYQFNGALKSEIAKIAQGDTVVHLYPTQMELLDVAIPSAQEQQKIADCLSSIDELIAAEARKLDVLKDHKKGLIQQLFPAEGETAPRLRFLEFKDAGEWAIRVLGEVMTERNQSPKENVPLFSLTIENGVTPKTERYERSFLVKDEEGAYKLMLPDDFAYNPMNLRFGAIGRHSGTENVAVSKYYNIFFCDGTVDSRFCEIYFKSDGMIAFYDNMASGSLIEKRRVHFSDFVRFNILFPLLPEQQTIADCLSSIDELIVAQTRKIDALEKLKKGMMQRLFPVLDEVEG